VGGLKVRIYYWNKRQIAKTLVILSAVFVIAVLGYDILKDDTVVMTLASQPIYQGDSRFQKMALTINVDWGEEFIPDMLKILKANNAKATFFITGRFAGKFPELVKMIAEDGHEIGNHGYSHPHPDKLSKKENQEEIKKTEQVIFEVSGVKTTLFAPPYGEHKPHVIEAAEELQYMVILWTIDTVDWDKNRKPQDIYEKILKNAQNGAIVLMHPTERTLKALENIVKDLQKKGFELTTLSQLLPKGK